MKKTALAIIIVTALLLFIIIPCFSEESGERTIRLGYYDLEEFLIGASEDAPKSGFAYDLLCEIAIVNGWTYELVYGSFSELLDMLCAGEIDLLPCVVFSEERAETLLFSGETISEERYFISMLTEEAKQLSDTDPSILNGARISSVTDAYQNVILEKWAADNGLEIEIICTDSFADSWAALERGDAEYVLNIDNSVLESGFSTLFEIGASYSHFAAAPGRENIIEGIDGAIRTIRQINPFTISHLQEKYLSGALSSYQLSENEKEWVRRHPVIRIAGLTSDVPYSYLDENGDVVGVFPEMLSSMLDSLNVTSGTEWTLFDTIDEMLAALKAGDADLICPYYHNYYLAQTNGLIVSDYTTEVPMGMLLPGNASAASDGRIATPATRLGIYYVNEYYPDAQILPCGSVSECIEAVYDGHAASAVAHFSVLQEFAKAYPDNFSIQILKNPCEVCFSALPENKDLIRLINRGLHLVSDSTIEAMEKTYSQTSEVFSLRRFMQEHLAEFIIFGSVMMLILGFLVERIFASRKLKKNVLEISLQKELIEQKEAELIAARDLANEANKAKTVFLFNMSHDIRTPMNAIIGYTAMARKYCTDQSPIAEYLGKIDIAGHNLLSIVNQVLEMSRIEAGKVELESETVDLTENFYVQKTIVEASAASRGITLNCSVEPLADRCVRTDVGRLNQIITNILGNAIKYTREGDTVTYTLRQLESGDADNGVYEFKVMDTGIGMSKDFVEHVFDQFSRERSSTVSGIQGTGLGMSIVKKIVAMMNGEIHVDSEPGKGTVVTVVLPMQIEHSRLQILEGTKSNIPDLAGKHVLLVEDNEMNREIASDLLTDCGLIIDSAENGEIAVRKLSGSLPGTYDFVLMDVQMPVMDGYEATVAIRRLENPDLASIPIVALSANAFEEDRQKSLSVGMNDHVAKPIDMNILLLTLAKYL